ncbi:DUF3606 domain-containing protein [Bosea sp. BK604]|uniref:DUF3606 domain-containing protein n=1 Tax=Bosea sp. BK604 TaxID=2512180 RepID=UPI0010463F9F|nr:DUF3606 domain-containing protein [Bosea sp. BK604]TCR68227.1 uncharacterized protein DUF3606 [Bosea sp. BK604]
MPAHSRLSGDKLSGWNSVATIECELDCQRVTEHIAELSGCLEGTDEEQKLAILVESFERWEHQRWPHLDAQHGEAIVPDDLADRGAQDRALINISEPHEVRYWTQKWSITEEKLKRAVARAGTSTDAVARHLGESRE